MIFGEDVRPRFPGGKRKALVMSYDDGSEHDRYLVEIFNRHGIRATFHLNSGKLDSPHHVSKQELRTLYAGHEVACHTVSHPDLTALSVSEVHREVGQDRACLEDLLGQPVRGLAYPFGKYNAQVVGVISELNIAYGRTTHITGRFDLPQTPLELTTTGHHNSAFALGEQFLADESDELVFMYLWGHSYELDGFMSGDRTKDWSYMEAFCRLMSGDSEIYYGTTVEVVDYLDGMRQLAWAGRPRRLHNRSALPLWVSWGKRCFEIPPGGKIPMAEPAEPPGSDYCTWGRQIGHLTMKEDTHSEDDAQTRDKRASPGDAERPLSSPKRSLEKRLRQKSGRLLGAQVADKATTFRLFAPRARKVTVSFFRYLDSPEPKTLELSRFDDGVWEVVHPANLHGWYYYYQVDSRHKGPFGHFDPSFKILDPYALVTVGPAGPGIVWDCRRSARRGVPFQPPCWHDLVVLEAHVRDLIRHAPVPLDEEERLGFSGLKKWIEADGSYLRSLGINAVELQPVQEYGDHYAKQEYHWGYMPVNFFAPESSYALVPELGSQIEEFQELVEAFHAHGIAVILDVVYNHIGEPNNLLHIDKHYYFQLDDEGNLTNWSGCGNDFRADTPMGRRLIIDSLIHLMRAYDVDGFRFDLAELIGVSVLQEVEKALKQVKPSVILIAEPWSFRGHIAREFKSTGFAFWNDGFREFVRDYLMGQGNQEGLRYFMAGSLDYLTAWPAQSVNYVESHDDHCWIDKVTENPNHWGEHPTANDRRRTHLMLAILMCSLGIPMLGAGQDMLRSKQGIHNSYRAGEVNALNYQRLLIYSGSHDYFRRWIRFRLSERGRPFCLDSPPGASFFRHFGAEHGSALAILYNADLSHGPRRLLFAINPHHEMAHIALDELDIRRWKQLADHERFEESGLTSARLPFAQGRLELPPLTCGLWEE